MTQEIDHDLLLRMAERVEFIYKWTANHDSRHSRTEGRLVALFTAILTTILGSFLYLMLR